MKITDSVKKLMEIEFWEKDPLEGGGTETLDSMINKFSEFEIFFEKLNEYEYLFKEANSILEIGGGQLWASCIIKKRYPLKKIIGTDLSQDAIAGAYIFERVFNVALDDRFPLDVEEQKNVDFQVDLIVCYAAAHHFTNFENTFLSLKQYLSSNGKILLLHEPFSSILFYKIALKRVNRKRPVVYEDLLQPKILKRAAKKTELGLKIIRQPSVTNRRGIASVYYHIISRAPFLSFVFPTSVDVILYKSK